MIGLMKKSATTSSLFSNFYDRGYSARYAGAKREFNVGVWRRMPGGLPVHRVITVDRGIVARPSLDHAAGGYWAPPPALTGDVSPA